MKNALFLKLGILALLLCSLSLDVSAQSRPAAKAKGISAADQTAIKELFKGVDPAKYRLQFNSRRDVVGKRAVKMEDIQQVKRVTNPAEAAGWIVFVVEGDDVIYVLAVGNSDLVSVIGKEKALKLNQIMAKYK